MRALFTRESTRGEDGDLVLSKSFHSRYKVPQQLKCENIKNLGKDIWNPNFRGPSRPQLQSDFYGFIIQPVQWYIRGGLHVQGFSRVKWRDWGDRFDSNERLLLSAVCRSTILSIHLLGRGWLLEPSRATILLIQLMMEGPPAMIYL